MSDQIGLTTLLVRDYDEAIAWFKQTLGFVLREDSPLSAGKRWVVVAPSPDGPGLLLARAATAAQVEQIGKQAGGRVAFFIFSRAFDARFAAMQNAGVRFLEAPRREAYGAVVQFEDLYGNRWDLLEVKD